jgi:hypothetical protein
LHQYRLQIDRLERLGGSPDPRVVQQVLDQLAHVGHGVDDVAQVLPGVLVGTPLAFLLDDLAVPGDGQQRRAQVVRHGRGEILEFAIGVGEFGGAFGHGRLQVRGIAVRALPARPVYVTQQLARVTEFLHVGERAEVEGLLGRVVGCRAGVNDHAHVLVEPANLCQQFGPAQVGQPEVYHGHAEIAAFELLNPLGGRTTADRLEPFCGQDFAE